MSDGSYGGAVERLMGMDRATWERHASPWSVWTRVPILPLLALSIYARAWIGWWCLVPVVALVVWTWLNPRVFQPPARLDSWASRGVMGERLWLARRERPIPAGHARAAHVLTGIAAIGMAPLLYGLVALDAWATVAGTAITFLGKMWFADRMVWLHDVMQSASPGAAPPANDPTPPPPTAPRPR